MQSLKTGVQQFQDQVFGEEKALFDKLAKGQQPVALFIACSDSRVCPNLLTQTKPGDLFILRAVGNIVPPFGALQGGEAATIEYAVAALNVKDIIICGHAKCGAMTALLKPQDIEKFPSVKSYLQHAAATRQIIEDNFAHVTDEAERVAQAIETNVLVQLDNLRTHPVVASALTRNEIRLHGWVYDFTTGNVVAYCPEQKKFIPLAQESS